jgi:uncharacterized protein with HEPN domain
LKRDPRLYLDDILDSVNRIEEYTEGLNFEAFAMDLGILKLLAKQQNVFHLELKRNIPIFRGG